MQCEISPLFLAWTRVSECTQLYFIAGKTNRAKLCQNNSNSWLLFQLQAKQEIYKTFGKRPILTNLKTGGFREILLLQVARYEKQGMDRYATDF